jgi:hypothetical protein
MPAKPALECVQFAAAFSLSQLAGWRNVAAALRRHFTPWRKEKWPDKPAATLRPQASLRERKRQQAARAPELRSVCRLKDTCHAPVEIPDLENLSR